MEKTSAVKMTTVDALRWILENVPDLPDAVVERVTAVKTTYENRKSSVSKATKERRDENTKILDLVLAWMPEDGATATDVMTAFMGNGIKSTQRAARLLNDAVKDGMLKKRTVKGASVYFLA